MSNDKYQASFYDPYPPRLAAEAAQVALAREKAAKLRRLRITVIGAAVVLAIFTIGAVWATTVNKANDKATEACYVQAEEAGWDRTLPTIKAICTDPERRDNIIPPAPTTGE